MKKTAITTILFIACFVSGIAQTPIEGMIDADTVLRKVHSPFLVVSDLVISPDGQITIEPGVDVRFAGGTKLEIRGTMIAIGLPSDSITFTADSATAKDSWIGIQIKNTQGGNAVLDYCNISCAFSAIQEECCWGGEVTVRNSTFSHNTTAVGGYSGDVTIIDSCYFDGNTYCLSGADKDVSNSIFDNNDYGLYQTERISVFHSTFTNHTQAALYGGRGTVSNCTITNNNIGIKALFEGFAVKNSIVSNNETGMILEGSIAPVDSNQICNNTTYNIINNSIYNTELFSNCWCEGDSVSIEDKIYDGYDDLDRGLVSYDIFDHECNTPIAQVNKNTGQSSEWILSESPYILTEDYVIFPDDTLTIVPGVEVRFAAGTGLDVRGTLMANGTRADSIIFTSLNDTTEGRWKGINIKNTMGGTAMFSYCNFMFASTAISEECCWGGEVTIRHSGFIANATAIGGYSGDVTIVDSCYFYGNNYCLVNADKEVSNCVFDSNEYGLYQTERISVSNSIFTNHAYAALYGGRGTLSGCTISNNNIGVKAFFQGFAIENCTISNNDTGIELADYDGYISPVRNNQVCGNTSFNIRNNSSYNIGLYSNCWCEDDSAGIEDKIYDGYDDAGKGLVSYDIFDPECDSVIANVNKTIGSSDIWTKANSPYILTNDYVVFPDDTLTIEPGVEVRITDSARFTVKGRLVATGTRSDSVTFTSHYGTTGGSWEGIRILNEQGGNAEFKYCNFKYASTAIYEECCWGGTVSASNSGFLSNVIAIGGYSGEFMIIDSCNFSGNTYCLTGADKKVTNSMFDLNEYGLYQTERTGVSNSTFTNHTQVALYGGRGTISNCTVRNNTVGVKAFFEGFTIENCTISNNGTGIELADYDGYIAPVKDNKICDNITYNIKLNSSYNTEVYENCWCNDDSATVEDKIYDGWDDIALGLVDYTLFSKNCISRIFKTTKEENRVYYYSSSVDAIEPAYITLYPNPASDYLFFEGQIPVTRISIHDYTGRLILDATKYDAETGKINIQYLKPGLYMVAFKLHNDQRIIKKITVKQ